jgi:hypothetical protein
MLKVFAEDLCYLIPVYITVYINPLGSARNYGRSGQFRQLLVDFTTAEILRFAQNDSAL